MRHDIINDLVKETLSLYSLGALSEYEAQAVERHLLVGCALCQSELDSMKSVVIALSLAASEAAPRPELKVRLLVRVAEEELLVSPFLRRES
jgi:hypothetical protein